MNKLFLSIVFLAASLVACNNAKTEQKATANTIVYEGKLKETIWEDKDVPMKIVLDKAAGTFTFDVDYNNNLMSEGEKVVDIKDMGTFKVEKDAKWGDLYVLSGNSTGTNYYQIDGKKIKGIDFEKTAYTGDELEMK